MLTTPWKEFCLDLAVAAVLRVGDEACLRSMKGLDESATAALVLMADFEGSRERALKFVVMEEGVRGGRA